MLRSRQYGGFHPGSVVVDEDHGKTCARITERRQSMAAQRETDHHTPDEIRRQLASQLQIDDWQLAGIANPVLSRLRHQLAIDELTGVLNRRAGLVALTSEIELVRKSAEPELALVFLDVDGLKLINDTRGHAAGDAALRCVGHVLKRCLRTGDVLFRYGGDEFICGLPHMNLESAGASLLEAWRQLQFQGQRNLSFSAGFAELQDDDDACRLIARADDCLYAGRRRYRRREWRFAS
jgi:diguanylate cyclase (GGDEF)-like protein